MNAINPLSVPALARKPAAPAKTGDNPALRRAFDQFVGETFYGQMIKAMRKTQNNPKGGIITKEGPIHISKVMKQERHEARKKKHGTAPAAAEA